MFVCNDFYLLFNEDKNNYGVGWIVLNIILNMFLNIILNIILNVIILLWVYQYMSEFGGILFLGIMGIYGGGGYFFDLLFFNLIEEFLIFLKENFWIDLRICVIFVEIVIYSV